MRGLSELKEMIEVARIELDESLLSADYTIYYEKSVYLDKLIEEYLDIKDGIIQTTESCY